MSRTVSGALLTAIQAPTSYDLKARVTIDKSLMAFSSLTRDHQLSNYWEGIPNFENRWDTSSAYISAISKATNAFTNADNNRLMFYCNPNASVISPTYGGSTRIGISPSIIDGYLYFVEPLGIYRYTLNTSALSSNNPACLSSQSNVGYYTGLVGVAGISSTECVSFQLTAYGVKVRYHVDSGGWSAVDSDDYIVFPTKPTTNYTGFYSRFTAAKLGTKIFAYATDPYTGAVLAKVLDTNTDTSTGHNWSSTFTAIPEDMSEFWVGSCFVSNSKIHMSGAFRRTEDFAAGQYYNLLLSSDDGYSFSMDRFSMITTLPGLYTCCTSGTTMYGMAGGGVGETPANYVIGSPSASLVIPDEDIISIQSSVQSPGGQGSIKVANGDHAYDDNTYLEEGNRLQLELGYATTGGDDYELMETFIIAQVSENIGDGENSLTLQVQTEASWRLSNQTAPFYTEMDSNSAVVDPVTNDGSILYPAPFNGRSLTEFYVDMWNSTGWEQDSGLEPLDMVVDGGAEAVISDASHAYAVLTGNIAGQNNLAGPPVVHEPPIDVEIYGWSRTPATGQTGDSVVKCFLVIDDSGSGADAFGVLPGRKKPEDYLPMPMPDPTQYIPRGDGNVSKSDSGGGGNISSRGLVGSAGIKERIDGYLIVEGSQISTYNRWQTAYYDTVAGANDSDPIKYRFDNVRLREGDKIIRVGLHISAPNASAFYVAGCKITSPNSPGISGVLRWEDTNTPWRGGENFMSLPGSGRPFVMFANKPYYSYNFDVSGKFNYHKGTSPMSSGKLAFGLLGHARDAQTYIGGRVNILDNKLEIYLQRNGVERVLASTAFTSSSTVVWLRFTHRDGVYKLYTKASATAKSWGDAKLTYTWIDADGAQIMGNMIYVNDKQISTFYAHVGIYGTREPLNFRTCGFAKGDSEAFGLLPGEDMTNFTAFPSSGEIEVDGARYAFTGKTGTVRGPSGPYQGLATRKVDWGTTQGVGIECSYFAWNASSTWWEDYVLSADNGHTYMTQGADWQPAVLVDGALDYGTRTSSRHMCLKASGNYIGKANRVVLGPGIAGLRAREEESNTHRYGTFVNLWVTDEIELYFFEASGGDGDSTVKDMVKRISNAAGVTAEFPGDITSASQGLSGTPWTLR